MCLLAKPEAREGALKQRTGGARTIFGGHYDECGTRRVKLSPTCIARAGGGLEPDFLTT
jgi:hypothetical protein